MNWNMYSQSLMYGEVIDAKDLFERIMCAENILRSRRVIELVLSDVVLETTTQLETYYIEDI